MPFSADETDSATLRIMQILADVDPDSLTPREALDILYRLKVEEENV